MTVFTTPSKNCFDGRAAGMRWRYSTDWKCRIRLSNGRTKQAANANSLPRSLPPSEQQIDRSPGWSIQ
jgi:hypothetical protein